MSAGPRGANGRSPSLSPNATSPQNLWDRVFALIRRIPPGRVMTYGQIAAHVGRLSPRAVGWALHGCPRDIPWHRVVNAAGGCSTDNLPGAPRGFQRALLENERVVFGPSGTLSLDRYRWVPRKKRERVRAGTILPARPRAARR